MRDTQLEKLLSRIPESENYEVMPFLDETAEGSSIITVDYQEEVLKRMLKEGFAVKSLQLHDSNRYFPLVVLTEKGRLLKKLKSFEAVYSQYPKYKPLEKVMQKTNWVRIIILVVLSIILLTFLIPGFWS
ncbi:MAG: hypothetical protein H7257_01265 [Taibaiella sp.]|nr:hypothetical protein [Taibaiella sp.]